MTNSLLFVLGAPDPEMDRIEKLLDECGITHTFATIGGVRVHPGNAYKADGIACGETSACQIILVEGAFDRALCGGCFTLLTDGTFPLGSVSTSIDHHRPGDPGYGVPPERFLRGSSIGQVVAFLAERGFLPDTWVWDHLCSATVERFQLISCGWLVSQFVNDIPDEPDSGHRYHALLPSDIVFAAAADHCLGAAYAGQCPGVDPDALFDWRVATRAEFQGRTVEEVRADVGRAIARVKNAPKVWLVAPQNKTEVIGALSTLVADLRGEEIPELPEAACRMGVAYLANPRPGPDGRKKVVLQNASPAHLAAWPQWAKEHGIVDCYGGDPARGFAGGYES